MNFTITSDYCHYKTLIDFSDGKLVFKYMFYWIVNFVRSVAVPITHV